MDEIITKYEKNEIIITEIILNNSKNIKLLRGFEQDSITQKKYMRNFVIMIENEFVTSNIADSMQLKEELFMFQNGDVQNKYFRLNTRLVNKETVSSLQFIFKNGKKIYVSKSEARAMVSLWSMALQGYSFARLLEFEKEQSLLSWAKVLERNGYL